MKKMVRPGQLRNLGKIKVYELSNHQWQREMFFRMVGEVGGIPSPLILYTNVALNKKYKDEKSSSSN